MVKLFVHQIRVRPVVVAHFQLLVVTTQRKVFDPKFLLDCITKKLL
jgi:hypothetical protein